MAVVFTKSYAATPHSRREILRYAGAREATDETVALMDECIALATGKESFKVCYTDVEISVDGEDGDLGFVRVRSASLAKNLAECDKAVIFAATAGIELDRLVARYSSLSPAKALMLQAIGAERIESLCDAFCEDLRAEYGDIRPRFSAGYGDLPLEFQKDIFSLLSCSKSIGLTLNESLLMSPIKSVTAIIGIKKTDQNNEIT